MTTLKIYQIDAFSDKIFGGNPAAVCPLDHWLEDELMQKIAMENNLSETAFFVKKEDVFELRWFTPLSEVDLCGHATLASAHLIFSEGFKKNEIVFHSPRSGNLMVRKSSDAYTMNFPSDIFKEIDTPQEIIDGLGIKPLQTYKGKTDFMAILDNQNEIEQLKPDFAILNKLEARGIITTSQGEKVDFVSRCFYPQCGVNEDPTTGSAHTTMTPFWAKKLGKNELNAIQLSSRKGVLNCKYLGDRVEITGKAVTYLKGEIFLKN